MAAQISIKIFVRNLTMIYYAPGDYLLGNFFQANNSYKFWDKNDENERHDALIIFD